MPCPSPLAVQANFFEFERAGKAFQIFRNVMERVSNRNSAGLTDALPDERIRRRVLEAVKGMSPRADAKWTLALHDSTHAAFAVLDVQTIPFVQNTLVPAARREASRVVTGELKNIDFIERNLTIIYPPTSKELDCLYDEALEDLLYERRLDLVQVTGRVLLDDQGSPKKIIDVSDIRDVDLSPLEISTVRHGKVSLRVALALLLEPILDDSQQLLYVENNALGITVFAPTHEALLTELNEHLAMLWQGYAQAKDDDLDDIALQLKQTLLARMSQVANAA